jgi:hypothetical protein
VAAASKATSIESGLFEIQARRFCNFGNVDKPSGSGRRSSMACTGMLSQPKATSRMWTSPLGILKAVHHRLSSMRTNPNALVIVTEWEQFRALPLKSAITVGARAQISNL